MKFSATWKDKEVTVESNMATRMHNGGPWRVVHRMGNLRGTGVSKKMFADFALKNVNVSGS